ncbi:MAG: glycosyltransferase family 2 protein [Zavarzinella sp.]
MNAWNRTTVEPKHLPSVSIVVPAFNEASVLPIFHQALVQVIENQPHFRWEIVYVDDGSKDHTLALMMGWSHLDARVRYVSLSRNFGHQAALCAGMDAATGDAVISMDCDMQHPPTVIPQLCQAWREGFDVVVTIRSNHHSLGWFKRGTSFLFMKMLRSISGLDIRPGVSDFRLLSRRALTALQALPEKQRFLRGMVQWLGFEKKEIPFNAPPRAAGKSKYRLLSMLLLARDGLLSFSRLPIHLALIFALICLGVSFVGSMIAALASSSIPSWIYAAIIGGHATAFGFWVCLFAFSEYLARIHEETLARPVYMVRHQSAATIYQVSTTSDAR